MKTIQLLQSKITALSGCSQLIARITICTVMWPHGAQLLLGLFGGGGFTATMQYFTETSELPWIIGVLVILIQFFGSIFILFGLFTRFMALSMAIITVGMIFSGHIEHGFFMNWFGAQQGEGFEFHLLLLGLCISLFLSKDFAFSVDKALRK
jgi:putative oxidoreductase